MALAVVQHQANTDLAGTATVAVTVSATGSGRLLVAGVVGVTATGSVSGVSDGTNAFTQAGSAIGTLSGAGFTDVWYLLSSTSGKTTITATFASAAAGKAIHVYEVSGWTTCALDVVGALSDQTGAVDNTDTGPSITTTGSTGFGMGIILPATGVSQNPKTGNAWTAGGDIDALGVAACSIITAATGAIQPVWLDNSPSSSFAASAVAFKDTGGGGGGRTLFYRSGLDGLSASGPKQFNPVL